MNYHSLSALSSAFFKQAILSHHKRFGGNHREALILFPKITSGREAKAKEVEPAGHFAKVSNILALTLLKES